MMTQYLGIHQVSTGAKYGSGKWSGKPSYICNRMKIAASARRMLDRCDVVLSHSRKQLQRYHNHISILLKLNCCLFVCLFVLFVCPDYIKEMEE